MDAPLLPPELVTAMDSIALNVGSAAHIEIDDDDDNDDAPPSRRGPRKGDLFFVRVFLFSNFPKSDIDLEVSK